MHDSASALVWRLRGRTLLDAAKRACTGIGFLFLLVTLTPLTRWWAAAMAGSFANPPTDGEVLVILGGSALGDGTIGGSSYWRAVYGVRIWRTGHYRHVLVCGGNSDGVAVSAAIRDYLVSQGVPADTILTEEQSLTTRENALFARPILAQFPGKKVLLTSDYHVYRAQRAFSRAGIQTTSFAFPDVYKLSLSWIGRWVGFLELCSETGKIAYYKARAWI
jgi:uncharacterized SAM-binding protein YcdF (DUF218 family)